jgi:D-lactate dehydrogenase
MTPDYPSLSRNLQGLLGKDRVIDDPLRTLAYGTDASFYRLIPKIVVRVDDEQQLRDVLREATRFRAAVTFRAAGTSLSGQAISDSVLVVMSGDGWHDCSISDDATEISLQPGVIGATANDRLLPFQKKIGPDPASIAAAKIGGIAANNASGMCCGTAQNSYNTLAAMRVVLHDGAVLDSRDDNSVESFRQSHAELLGELHSLSSSVKADSELSERIRHKYRLKNTTGYSLNALIDFDDPIDILTHLMIGSEGTLGFISSITYKTVPEHPFKTTALVIFDTIETACQAVATLKPLPVTAVELMDRAALRSVEDKPDMPGFLKALPVEAAALLIDVRAQSEARLQEDVDQVRTALVAHAPILPVEFTDNAVDYQVLWNIRKGLFPAVGAVRVTGTTVIIEDVAFPVPQLATAVRHLQALFNKYHYDEAIIFGHALEGNLHFVFTQDFSDPAEVARYQGFMDEVCALVVDGYGGSLKAEHGTGRNMAPFVEMEWGKDAYQLMWRLKRLFDPNNLLNPGVILNDDKDIHLQSLKALPAADGLVDKCIECGFCEAICPSRDLTLTPRQRIVLWREISQLGRSGKDPERWSALKKAFDYQGIDTCAGDGLCSLRCPVGIDTGKLVRKLRHERRGDLAQRSADWANQHFGLIEKGTRFGLASAALAQRLMGDGAVESISKGLNRLSGMIPVWDTTMPVSSGGLRKIPAQAKKINGSVVYFPSCVSRNMGPARHDPYTDPLYERMQGLLAKSGFEVIFPEPVEGLCCGMPLHSKGFPRQANEALSRLEQALWQASNEGAYPVLCDTSPCALRMIEGFTRPLKIQEPIGFISEHLMPHLKVTRKMPSISLHVTCSARKMGLERAMLDLARQCADEVFVAEDKGCCGFAGDKGFTTPELNASALKRLRAALPEGCAQGFSNSRTCEIGLTRHAGIPYQSIAYLVDSCCSQMDG